jgi:hypothetical protein
MRKALTLTLLLIGTALISGCGESAPAAGDPVKQIDSNAKPTLPPPSSSVGGAAPAQGGGSQSAPI